MEGIKVALYLTFVVGFGLVIVFAWPVVATLAAVVYGCLSGL